VEERKNTLSRERRIVVTPFFFQIPRAILEGEEEGLDVCSKKSPPAASKTKTGAATRPLNGKRKGAGPSLPPKKKE